MVYYTEILARFDFAESDMEYILSIKEQMQQYEVAFLNDVLSYLQKDSLFMSEYGNIIDKLNTEKLSRWYSAVISGRLNGSFSEFISEFNLQQVPRGAFSGERLPAFPRRKRRRQADRCRFRYKPGFPAGASESAPERLRRQPAHKDWGRGFDTRFPSGEAAGRTERLPQRTEPRGEQPARRR